MTLKKLRIFIDFEKLRIFYLDPHLETFPSKKNLVTILEMDLQQILNTIGKCCLIFIVYFSYLIKNHLPFNISLWLSVYLSFLTLLVYLVTCIPDHVLEYYVPDSLYYCLVGVLTVLLPILVYLYTVLVMCHCLSLLLVLTILVVFLLP